MSYLELSSENAKQYDSSPSGGRANSLLLSNPATRSVSTGPHPEATAEAVLKLVDTNDPPLRLGLGNSIPSTARTAYAERLATWEAWEDVSNVAMAEPKKTTAAWTEHLVHGTPDQA